MVRSSIRPVITIQPDGCPPAGSWRRTERVPTELESRQWRRRQGADLCCVVAAGALGAGVLGGLGAGVGVALWAVVASGSAPLWWACATAAGPATLAVAWAVRAVRWRLKARRPEDLRILVIDIFEARALWIGEWHDAEGWLFVLDRETSVFLPGQGRWFADDPDWEIDGAVVPQALTLAIAVAGDGSCKMLACHDRGPLRIIPSASQSIGSVVLSAKIAVGDDLTLLPTPSDLRSESWRSVSDGPVRIDDVPN